MGEPTIRAAVPSDMGAVAAIYNHYAATSHVTFDTEPSTVSSWRHHLASLEGAGPYLLLVVDVDGEVVGWAASGPLRAKPAYVHSVETTVYLDPAARGRGLGSTLYRALLADLDRRDVHRAYAAIALPNPSSVALHAACGFRKVGRFAEVGFKHGSYWDVAWYERPC